MGTQPPASYLAQTMKILIVAVPLPSVSRTGTVLDTNQPFVVSRGGCTSSNWGSGCPTECQNVTSNEGASIINLSFIDGVSLYCCGTPIVDGASTACPSGSPFQMDSAELILGRAGLSGVTNSSSTATSNLTALPTGTGSSSPQASSTSGNHDAAIGAGVGVPLGVIALGSIIWAFWERRRANKASRALTRAPWSDEREMARRWGGRSTAPTELDSGGYPSELMSSERSATHS
ncbi:hypothetical protein N7468_003513 [Penicillium chermesinum]|uniref:Uncharacterized protein n=1 Tax=Penicillium chermesinum TaxID=63820 RepID=A0A9W9P6J5_9EURO|nr:uncharacterized protein N7468_003513 [Penicillium chermesinum]KAJ5238894.1 hypothetical protein N7468_003513 [Penicillium chermesinum]